MVTPFLMYSVSIWAPRLAMWMFDTNEVSNRHDVVTGDKAAKNSPPEIIQAKVAIEASKQMAIWERTKRSWFNNNGLTLTTWHHFHIVHLSKMIKPTRYWGKSYDSSIIPKKHGSHQWSHCHQYGMLKRIINYMNLERVLGQVHIP